MVALSMSSLLQCPFKHLFPFHHPYSNSLHPYSVPRRLHPSYQTVRILCAKRTGKQRYPSEKKKLKLKQKEALSLVTNKFEGIWRFSKLAVPVQNDPGKDFLQVHLVASMLPEEAFSVVRKSFDARKAPHIEYPVRTNQIPWEISAQKYPSWLLVLGAGTLPFSSSFSPSCLASGWDEFTTSSEPEWTCLCYSVLGVFSLHGSCDHVCNRNCRIPFFILVRSLLKKLPPNTEKWHVEDLEPWGWRLSLGLAAIPALLTTVGGCLLPETPNSLIERGSKGRGRNVLERIRGTDNVDAEFEDMVEASNNNKILFPYVMGVRGGGVVGCPNVRLRAASVEDLRHLQSMGFGGNASLYSSALTGAVLAGSTFISIALVDRLGRRVLLISGGIQMIISFGWSWRPLGWTVPSEIFPLETRSAGQDITVAVNLLFTFIIAQCFLAMFCHFKFGIFLFFAGWITVMTVFIFFFLPETKGVPIEEMIFLWRKHWFWKKIIPEYPELEDQTV
ncbi:Sugar transport protein 7 [Hibiscus syriacus]|uniref:Sugar transport protein 7 n=1 Tax=Hibiscus syriacus TaxID=106335 RepID=A0A6A3CQ77_HIBSY|nr:Sugar transport protein 7 [Hibiscus syriacus]